MTSILFVRIASGLDREEFDRRLAERRPRFREVPGLLQKVYGRDPETGDQPAVVGRDRVVVPEVDDRPRIGPHRVVIQRPTAGRPLRGHMGAPMWRRAGIRASS